MELQPNHPAAPDNCNQMSGIPRYRHLILFRALIAERMIEIESLPITGDKKLVLMNALDGVPTNMPFRAGQRHNLTRDEIQSRSIAMLMRCARQQLHAETYPDDGPLLSRPVLQVFDQTTAMQGIHSFGEGA